MSSRFFVLMFASALAVNSAHANSTGEVISAVVSAVKGQIGKTTTAISDSAKALSLTGYQVIGEAASSGKVLMVKSIDEGTSVLGFAKRDSALYQSAGEIEIALARPTSEMEGKYLLELEGKRPSALNPMNPAIMEVSGFVSAGSYKLSAAFNDFKKSLGEFGIPSDAIISGLSLPQKVGEGKFVVVDSFRLQASKIDAGVIKQVIDAAKTAALK